MWAMYRPLEYLAKMRDDAAHPERLYQDRETEKVAFYFQDIVNVEQQLSFGKVDYGDGN